jgi:hypothetical protein
MDDFAHPFPIHLSGAQPFRKGKYGGQPESVASKLLGQAHELASEGFQVAEQICHLLGIRLKLGHRRSFATGYLMNDKPVGAAVANSPQAGANSAIGFFSMTGGTVEGKQRSTMAGLTL